MHIKTSNQGVLDLGFGSNTCNWGVHFCGLYETEKERDDIILAFLSQGFIDKDLQLYCPVERTEDEFCDAMTTFCPECKSQINNLDFFQVYSAKDLYYPDGSFSPWAMDDALNAFFKQSQANGPRNVRASAEMVWAIERIPGVENLMAYESRLNYFIDGKSWVSICLYNVTKFDGRTILRVLQTHPWIISKGIITRNPMFIDPDIWLAENAPEFLKRTA